MGRLSVWVAVIGAVFQAFVHASSDDAKILDIQVTAPGKVSDLSRYKRSLENSMVELGKEDGTASLGPGAIHIDFNPDDPLFGKSAFTFALKCRFGNLEPFPTNNYPFAGRWDAARSGRSIGFCFGSFESGVNFGVSSDGDAASIRVTKTNDLSANQFVILIGRYNPGVALIVETFDEFGNSLERKIQRADIPQEIFEAPSTPFLIGAPSVNQMDFVRMAVWSVGLDDSELQETLEASSFFK